MSKTPAKLAATGATLAITSFGVGLFHESLPILIWNTATAIALVMLVGLCGMLAFAFGVFAVILLGVMAIATTPLGILLVLSCIVLMRFRSRLQA